MAERLRRPRTLLVLGFAVVVLAAWLVPLGSFATRDRGVVTANPGLRPFTSVVQFPLKRDQEACVDPVPFEERAGKAVFAVVAKRGPVPPLEVTASGPGYQATGRAEDYPATGRPEPVEVTFDPPGKDVIGRLCWRNDGRRTVALVGTDEGKSVSAAQTTIDGELQAADVQLMVGEVEQRGLTARAGQLAERVADITGGMPVWFVWLLLVVVVLGFPVGAAFALWRSATDPEPSGPGVLDAGDDGPDRLDPPRS